MMEKSAIGNLTATEILYIENKKLNEELIQEKIESAAVIAEITQKYKKTQKLYEAARSELKKENKLHPFLDSQLVADPYGTQDILRWRISAAKVNWNDDYDFGMIKINVLNGDTGYVETVCTCFSKSALLSQQSYIMNIMIEDISETLTRELSEYIKNKTKQGLDDE